MVRTATFIIILLAFIGDAPAMAAKLMESASYSFTDAVSDREGCELALTRVKKKVLELVCGTQFSGGSARFHTEEQDEMSLFLFESVGGRVTNTEIYRKVVTTLNRTASLEDAVKQCSITAMVEVVCDQGRRDPSFAPSFVSEVQLNETVFRENDSMRIRLIAASEMYVNVFQYLPAEKGAENVLLVFPNLMQRDSFLKAGQELRIPDADTARGYRLAMRLPTGKEKAVEELMLVATKNRVAFPDSMTLGEFHRILAEIPLDDRREAIIPYFIAKKGKEGSESLE